MILRGKYRIFPTLTLLLTHLFNKYKLSTHSVAYAVLDKFCIMIMNIRTKDSRIEMQ